MPRVPAHLRTVKIGVERRIFAMTTSKMYLDQFENMGLPAWLRLHCLVRGSAGKYESEAHFAPGDVQRSMLIRSRDGSPQPIDPSSLTKAIRQGIELGFLDKGSKPTHLMIPEGWEYESPRARLGDSVQNN